MQKGQSCETQGGSPEVAATVGYWQNVLITTIQVNLVLILSEAGGGNTNLPKFPLKILSLSHHHSHF